MHNKTSRGAMCMSAKIGSLIAQIIPNSNPVTCFKLIHLNSVFTLVTG